MKKKINKWDSVVIFDEIEKQYTICFDGDGGAIISNKDYENAEKKFIEAMKIGRAHV